MFKNISRLHGALLFFMTVMSSAASAADIYGYIDAAGVPTFSDAPDSSRYQLVLATQGANPATPTKKRQRFSPGRTAYADVIKQEALSNKLDPLLVEAIISVESGHDPQARSRAGALGLMQLMPATASRYGITDLYHPEDNIRAGTRYLRDLLALFNDDVSLALAAYNAGENAVMRHGNRIPPYAETRAYVPKVLLRYAALKTSRQSQGL